MSTVSEEKMKELLKPLTDKLDEIKNTVNNIQTKLNDRGSGVLVGMPMSPKGMPLNAMSPYGVPAMLGVSHGGAKKKKGSKSSKRSKKGSKNSKSKKSKKH